MPEFSLLPRKEEILKLPRWARVAFAARCARHVQPLLILSWPEAPKNHIDAIETAIQLAANAAAVGTASPVGASKFATADASGNLASSSADAAIAAEAAAADDARCAALAARFAVAMTIAADCAEAADKADDDADDADSDAAMRGGFAVADDYAAAAMCATAVAAHAITEAAAIYATFDAGIDSPQRRIIAQQIRDDFDLLFQKAISEGWSDRTPVTLES